MWVIPLVSRRALAQEIRHLADGVARPVSSDPDWERHAMDRLALLRQLARRFRLKRLARERDRMHVGLLMEQQLDHRLTYFRLSRTVW